MDNKYKAVWVSHSSISDFIACPRRYYLRNVYKDPKTGNKITVTTASLSLGQAVHEVIDSLSVLPQDQRFLINLDKRLEVAWKKVEGRIGGFISDQQEKEFKQRALDMLKKIEINPGPILNKAIKIQTDFIPNYYLSEEEGIILCGKVDWLEYLEESDSVHVIDFKTGKNTENEESLQLPIYLLLASNTQTKKVTKASYWYLENEKGLVEKQLPSILEANDKVLTVARRIKLARQLNHFVCPTKGCQKCRPLERILKGEGLKVGVSDTNQDIYVLK